MYDLNLLPLVMHQLRTFRSAELRIETAGILQAILLKHAGKLTTEKAGWVRVMLWSVCMLMSVSD